MVELETIVNSQNETRLSDATQESYLTICSRVAYDIILNCFSEIAKSRVSCEQQGDNMVLCIQVFRKVVGPSCVKIYNFEPNVS